MAASLGVSTARILMRSRARRLRHYAKVSATAPSPSRGQREIARAQPARLVALLISVRSLLVRGGIGGRQGAAVHRDLVELALEVVLAVGTAADEDALCARR